MEIYKILSDLMSEKDLTIADVARLSDLPDSTVRGIIKRKQNTIALDVAFKLARGLEISLEELNGIATEEGMDSFEPNPNKSTSSFNDVLNEMSFGERLVAARERKGLRQKDLAEKMGVTKTCINYWEKDKRQPNIIDIKNLCDILGISGNDLLGIKTPADEWQGLSKEAINVANCYENADEDGKALLLHLAGYVATTKPVSSPQTMDAETVAEIYRSLQELIDSQRDIREVGQK